jgi:hypothetical protein
VGTRQGEEGAGRGGGGEGLPIDALLTDWCIRRSIHTAGVQPYIEPAAGMTFARNIFAFLTTEDSAGMDISVNAYTSATLAASSSLMTNPASAAVYNFTNASNPALTDPVVQQLDWNLYFEAVHNASSLSQFGWDLHALSGQNPDFVEPASTADWNRTFADLALQPDSPAYGIPGFRPIDVSSIGIVPESFPWGGLVAATWARRGAGGAKIQAETYDRQVRHSLSEASSAG